MGYPPENPPGVTDCRCREGHQGSQGHQHRHNLCYPQQHEHHPYCKEVPLYDGRNNTRDRVRVFYDIQIVKLAGSERWRFIVPIIRIEYLNGLAVRSNGQVKTFVRLKYSQQHSMFDARQAFIGNSPIKVSSIDVTADRVNIEENGEVAVFFQAFNTNDVGLGMSKAAVIPRDDATFSDSVVL